MLAAAPHGEVQLLPVTLCAMAWPHQSLQHNCLSSVFSVCPWAWWPAQQLPLVSPASSCPLGFPPGGAVLTRGEEFGDGAAAAHEGVPGQAGLPSRACGGAQCQERYRLPPTPSPQTAQDQLRVRQGHGQDRVVDSWQVSHLHPRGLGQLGQCIAVPQYLGKLQDNGLTVRALQRPEAFGL